MRHALDREIAVINTIMIADKNAEAFLKLLTEERFICPEVKEFFIGINAIYQRSGVVPDRQAVLLGPQFEELAGLSLFQVASTHPDDPKLGVSLSTIQNVCLGSAWQHVAVPELNPEAVRPVQGEG